MRPCTGNKTEISIDRDFHAIVREETDDGCVVLKHTKMMKPDEANLIKMKAFYSSLMLTEMSLAGEAEAFVAASRPPSGGCD
jgi:hypothetical protein